MSQKSKQMQRRKRYLVSVIQLKYAGLILAVAFGVTILCGYTVYYTAMMTMGDKLAKVYPQGMLVGIVKSVNLRMILNLVLVTPLIALVGILASHRIAGPLVRIERQLGEIANGDLKTRVILRKSDEIKSLADGINNLIEQFKYNITDELTSIRLITTDVARLKEEVGAQTIEKDKIQHTTMKIDEEIGHLQKKLHKYKI